MADRESPVVHTAAGKVEGSHGDGMFVFRGVPYAEPPVGPRRWLPPAPKSRWDGVRPAKEFAAAAVQPTTHSIELIRYLVEVLEPHSEDCLYLNVWSPGLDDAKRPVMMWIHPGGGEHGAGSQRAYDGRALARRGDVVVVTINFRLGALGALRLTDLTDGRIPSTGNEVILDHIAALTWIRENIAAFGGDPDNVTIFGESSGAVQCAALLATPQASGLFHRAILQSSFAHTAQTADSANRVARHVLDLLDVRPGDVDALLSVPAEQLVATTHPLMARMLEEDPSAGFMHYHPVIDGVVLHDLPIDAIRKGAADGVSLLAGSNLDENRIALAADAATLPAIEAQLRGTLSFIPETDRQELIDTYRLLLQKRGVAAEPIDVVSALVTDRVLRIPKIRLLEAKQSQRAPGYAYLLTWESPALQGHLRACHSLEMGFIFGTYDDRFCGTGPDADATAIRIQDSWSAFARSGDPSCDSIGRWSPYGPDRQTMLLGKNCEVVSAPYDEERAAWDKFGDDVFGRM